VIYEWQDAKYLGIDRDGRGTADNEWEDEVCLLSFSLTPMQTLLV
jgi:hypothetical protein